MLDISIVIILLLFTIIGYQRGLVRSAISLVSSVLSFVLSLMIYPLINTLLKGTPLYTSLYEGILSKVETIEFKEGVLIEQLNWLPTIITEQVQNNNNARMYETLGVKTLPEYIATYVTYIVISLLAILITWLLIKIVLVGGLKILSDIVESLPIISTVNRGGGLVFGLIKGLLTLSIIALILPFFMSYPFFEVVNKSIEQSILAQYLYDNNLIIQICHYFFE